MKTCVLILGALLAAPAAIGEEAQSEQKAEKPALRLPPGMARADEPEEVAALYSEEHEKRVEKLQEQAPDEDRLTAAEEYQLKLIAYRTQLVEEQRQRKIKELELELEREARLRAEKAAAIAERERRRESIYLQHHSVHAYQRNLNDEYWRQQRLLRAMEKKQQCHKPQPCPAPAPSPSPAPASSEDEAAGDVLP